MPSYKNIYTGIGSRRVTAPAAASILEVAALLDERGYTLRSGGADGSDTLFESKSTKKEIYLPAQGFNHNTSSLYNIPSEAFEIAKKYHPKWDNLNNFVRKLMARNVQQVLGQDLDSPTDFVVCWTPDGCEHHRDRTINTGGTGMAISIATDYCSIPVFNLFNPASLNLLHVCL